MDLKNTIQFLKELKGNNHKEWFDENRKRYEGCRKAFAKITQDIIDGIAKYDPELSAVEAKSCMFRINRDIRFSKDKTPYKTNFGALMGAQGKKTEGTGYYIHIAPEYNFIGGGIYKPSADKLAAIRQEIDYNPEPLEKLIKSKDFRETFGEIRGETLKTAPKGYPTDHANIELLRLKSFYVLKEYDDQDVCAEDFIKEALEIYKKAFGFNQYLKEAIS